jgi:hypothetical protein
MKTAFTVRQRSGTSGSGKGRGTASLKKVDST